MKSIDDVDSSRMVKVTAEELRSKISMPEWARFVKTGVSRERPPENDDWWYVRAASILRRISKRKNVGAQRLRTYYGGLHRRGHKPAHFARGSGKVIRTIMQDLEKAGFVKKDKKGRIITPEGTKFLNHVARKIE